MQIAVHVFPRSKQNALEWAQDGLKARLTAPPVDGAANEALIKLLAEQLDIPLGKDSQHRKSMTLIKLLAEQLDIPRWNISIVRGTTSRHKMVEVAGMTLEELHTRLTQ